MALLVAACQKAPELVVTSPTSIELSADGGSSTINFTANRDWTSSCSDSWVSISPASGSAADGPVAIRVSCNANTTYEDRTATVTIRMEDLSQTISIRQPANLGVVLSTNKYELTSDARTIEVEVKANIQYKVEISASWIKQTGTKALTSNTLKFSVEENKTYDNREGKITIKSQQSGVADQVISVVQAQKDAMEVEKTSYEMPYGGGEIELKVQANVSFGVFPKVDWIHHVQTKALSNSTVVLKVDENPTYVSREGKVEIAQQNGSLKYTITVRQAGRIAVTSVSLNKTTLKLKEGENETLIATVTPDNATDKTVTWTSSNPAIATVDENGKVAAIKEGEATITAKAGEKEATCSVLVKNDVPVSSIVLNKTSLTLTKGASETLEATVKPDDATDKTLTWKSSNTNVATVENGTIKGIGIGTATITASSGNVSGTCSVTVLSDAADGVYARYLGGSAVIINGVYQSGSKLNFSVINYSTEEINVVNVQLVNGVTMAAGNKLTINSSIPSGQSSTWTITVGALGIQSPIARFTYTFKGEEYTCEASSF